MGVNIPFFPRQTLVGNNGFGPTYYSEPFESSQFDSIMVRLKVDAVIGTNPSIDAAIETAPSLEDDWWDSATFTQFAGPTTENKMVVAADMSQFVRARISFTAGTDVVATMSILGVARETAG